MIPTEPDIRQLARKVLRRVTCVSGEEVEALVRAVLAQPEPPTDSHGSSRPSEAEAELLRLCNELESLSDIASQVVKENRRLRNGDVLVQHFRDEVKLLGLERDKLREQLAEAQAALKPFAKACYNTAGADNENYMPAYISGPTIADFRRAADVLKRQGVSE